MKILITGACGFIGRNLIKELEPNHELRLLDQNRPEEATVWAPSTPTGRALSPIKTDWPFIQAEIIDDTAMRAACQGMDAVVHLAGQPSGLPEIGVEIFRTNALGTFVAINEAHQVGVQRFMCASSINAFGTIYWRLSGKPSPYDRMPIDETFPPVPEDPYSLSKLVNEETCAAFNRAYNMTTAAFRFAGVWSQEVYEKRMNDGLKPTEQWLDDLFQWVHIADIVTGIRQALEKPDLPGFGAYTLSAGDTRCPEPTMDILRKFRPDLAQNVVTPLEGRAPLLSIGLAQRTFGYSPRYRLGP
jgi:nucleoside-diphosphate-sugar epimerase